MKNIPITPQEEKNKIKNNLKPNKLSFNMLKIKKLPNNQETNLKTTPSTPHYERKFSTNFKFNNTKTNNKINNDYELEQKNKYFFKKLFEIKHNNSYKKFKIFNFNPHPHRKDGHIKLDIMNLAQQNLYMLKRLYEKKSEYSVKKMEKDYQCYQRYKKIMCKFPEINFNKTRGLNSNSNTNTIIDTKFLKSEKSERSTFLPTINYINEGSMIKIKKKLFKDMKLKDLSLITPRNLTKDFIKNINKNDTSNNANNKENIKEETEIEIDKGYKNIKSENLE